jgi:phospholipase C
LFVVTYDEHGGFFDHVPPPATVDANPEFQRLGFRVPTLCAGPFVKKGCVVSTQFEHASIIKTLITRFGIQSPNARASAANDLSSVIQPGYLQLPQPPVTLPKLTISPTKILARKLRSGHHPEMWSAAESGVIPRHLDRRSRGLGETAHVLKWAEKLGAIRIIP